MKIEPLAFACESTIKLLKELGPNAHVWPMIRATTAKDWKCEFPLYSEEQMRQLGEACAAACERTPKMQAYGNNRAVQDECASEIRKLIKELLP